MKSGVISKSEFNITSELLDQDARAKELLLLGDFSGLLTFNQDALLQSILAAIDSPFLPKGNTVRSTLLTNNAIDS